MPDASLRSVAKLHSRQLKQFERADTTLDSVATVPSGTAVGTKFYFATLPTNARIHGSSFILAKALGGGTMNLGFEGFENPDVAAVPTALLTGFALTAATTAGTRPPLIGDPSNNGKLVWELMGLAKDPGGFVELVGTTAGAATTTAGDVIVSLNMHNG